MSHVVPRWRRLALGLALAVFLLPAHAVTPRPQAPAAPPTPSEPAAGPLRIVGGLGGVNQYTRLEQPFWTDTLARLSGGRHRAEIQSFDRAGIRAPEMLSLIQLGVVPFGTVLLSVDAGRDVEIAAPDLAGLNPDMASLRRTVTAFRPWLADMLRERRGLELLAVYTYPAQVLFCNAPLRGLADVAGKRVRTSSPPQADLVLALGGTPVPTAFREVVENLRAGNIDCAITGTMPGNDIGLHEHTTHLHTMALNWGLSMFVANASAWSALPEDLRSLLRRELPRLEAEIWASAERETAQGHACNTGAAGCTEGRRGRMTAVATGPADDALRRELFERIVLPRWLERCGPGCGAVWNQTLAGVTGVRAPGNGDVPAAAAVPAPTSAPTSATPTRSPVAPGVRAAAR